MAWWSKKSVPDDTYNTVARLRTLHHEQEEIERSRDRAHELREFNDERDREWAKEQRRRQHEKDQDYNKRWFRPAPDNPILPINKHDHPLTKIIKGAANREVEGWRAGNREREYKREQEKEARERSAQMKSDEQGHQEKLKTRERVEGHRQGNTMRKDWWNDPIGREESKDKAKARSWTSPWGDDEPPKRAQSEQPKARSWNPWKRDEGPRAAPAADKTPLARWWEEQMARQRPEQPIEVKREPGRAPTQEQPEIRRTSKGRPPRARGGPDDRSRGPTLQPGGL